jgi:glycosyltransferase involved in cell wall biosynthesis
LGQLFKHKQKIILSPHSTIPFSRYNYFQNLIYFRVLHQSDCILYLCEAQRTFLKNLYGLSKHHSNVVYNGIDTNYFNPDLFNDISEKKLRSTYGVMDKDKVIIQVARLQKEKCHADAIMALVHLNTDKKMPGVHLLIVGSGNTDYISNLKSIVQKEKLDKYVHFVGNQSDVRPFLMIADLFTLTSESETFSIAALEAMSFGLPVVITDVGGAKEMVVSGLNGSLVKPHNVLELAKAWKNILDMNLDSKKIRDHVVKKFSIDDRLTVVETAVVELKIDVAELKSDVGELKSKAMSSLLYVGFGNITDIPTAVDTKYLFSFILKYLAPCCG